MALITAGKASFTCNICGSECEAGPEQLGRDVSSCPTRNSTPRTRAVVQVVSEALFGHNLPLAEFPHRPGLKGIGLSDWGYDRVLAERFDYQNTFYDTEPQLDITDPPEELLGALDFLISSDVFEHVPPPVERAFSGAFRLLKPGGLLVLTVPFLRDGETLEHFPSLDDYRRMEADGKLRFHEGPGLTLEMRIFSRPALRRHLHSAGFREITNWRNHITDPCWQENHSYPFTARRPMTAL